MSETRSADYARLPVGLLRVNADERVIGVDTAFCRVFECEAADVAGRPFEDLLSRRDRRSTQQFYEGLVRHREGVFDALVTLTLGRRDHFARLRLLRSPEGWVVFAEPALAPGGVLGRMLETQERWAAVFQASDEGIAILDGGGNILELNPRFHELMGFRSKHGIALSEGALIGRAITDPELLGDALAPLAEGPPAARTVVRGKRVVELRAGEITLPVRGVTGRWVVARDVTQRREIEELKIRQAQAHYAGMAEVATNVL
ncbi:MAG TPA: PAS domain-containing protein, partial [Polyangiaceae bacterium]|nr:PAS domain-containing protein [Polyangiaceae bacterium]